MSFDDYLDSRVEAYENRREATKEIRGFLKENPMTFSQLAKYVQENNKKEWEKALSSKGCAWLLDYCKGGKYCRN